jgi:formylglycine-generating enzyme required for sulfatase activity
VAPSPRWRPRLVAAVAAALILAAGAGCGDDEGTPCQRDTECGAGQICSAPGAAGQCVAASLATRPALDTVAVPAGAFVMGCDPAADSDCSARAQPLHEVTTAAFAIDRTEVTARAFADFLTLQGDDCGGQDCVKAARPALPVESPDGVGWKASAGLAERPMVEVTWYGARDFCAWRGQTLCTEAQWEKAARGGCELAAGDCAAAARRFPWGAQEPTCERAHMFEGSAGCGTGAPAASGGRAAGASPYGALDMAGNVWEWVVDHLHEGYAGAPTDGSAWLEEAGRFRIIKGGGAGSDAKYLRPAFRGDSAPEDGHEFRGFRCCRAAD